MFELNLPKAELKLANRAGKPCIWDAFRKKWLQLTPEEYVRQHFMSFLCAHRMYPASLVSIERGIAAHALARRTDIVVYDCEQQPFILVECKAPYVPINQSTLEQASAYNKTIKAPYLCVTNGLVHAYFKIDHEKAHYVQIEELPLYIRQM